MLSEQELDTLYGEVNRPYSPKELTAHLADREVKSALKATHAHNLELIAQVQGWLDFIGGKGPRPENKLWRLLMPGTNEENPACLRLETITEYFARYGHGDTPRMPIVVIASRSTVTLIERIRSGDDWPPKPATAADVKTAAELIVAALAKSHPAEPPRRKVQKHLESEKDSSAVKRDDDTRRVITEINRRHRAKRGSYPKIIGAMTKDPVWGARMRHMSAKTWKSRAIERKKK